MLDPFLLDALQLAAPMDWDAKPGYQVCRCSPPVVLDLAASKVVATQPGGWVRISLSEDPLTSRELGAVEHHLRRVLEAMWPIWSGRMCDMAFHSTRCLDSSSDFVLRSQRLYGVVSGSASRGLHLAKARLQVLGVWIDEKRFGLWYDVRL
jgi:hypothetical protein